MIVGATVSTVERQLAFAHCQDFSVVPFTRSDGERDG